MKITELKCTACNGTLKIDENNPHIAVCEYCQSTYAIESDNHENVYFTHSGQNSSGKSVITATKVESGVSAKTRIFLSIVLLSLFYLGARGVVSYYEKKAGEEAAVSQADSRLESQTTEKEEKVLSGPLGAMAESVVGRPAKDLTPDELSRFKWLDITYGTDDVRIGYSLENPYEAPDAELTWLTYPRENGGIEYELLSRFTGLKKLEMAGYLNSDALKGLSLEGISCNAESPLELAKIYPGVSGLKEVRFLSGINNLDGLDQYQNLESLTFDGLNISDIKTLASRKNLKSLTLINCDNISDFSVLSVMQGLESLSVESEGIRDTGFTAGLTNLKSFSITDAKILSVNDLKALTGLTSLTIDNCDELKDLSGIQGLTGLKELTLEIPSNCPQPDLSGLTGLIKLSVSRADDVGFLHNMNALEELKLEGCRVNSKDAFSGLTGLKKLTCNRLFGDFSNLSFVGDIPSLEYLNVDGMSTYEDISGIFRAPALQEIYLNGVECELNFEKVQPTEMLKVLEMDGVKLYKNVKISGGGGIYSVDYDKVVLDEHLDFFAKFPGLKKLSLADNTLTGIGFASSLPMLEELNISGNYVTDLKPLQNLRELKTVICTDNPIENDRVLNENVMIIK